MSGLVDQQVALITISQRKDFLAANSARRVATPGFVLLVRQRGDDAQTKRLGITVTKKIGNAVVRNRMKRRFRALARELIAPDGVAGADHILIGRAGGVERDFAVLRVDLTKALARAKDVAPTKAGVSADVHAKASHRPRPSPGRHSDAKA